MKRLKVLVSAFACSPYKGSERGVGWNIVSRLAKYHDITVLYGDIAKEQTNRLDVEKWIAENGEISGLTLKYIPQNKTGLFLDQMSHIKPLIFLHYFAYRCWQKKAFRVAVQLQKTKPFDLAHVLTYIGYREPGYLWKLPIPFFWGPINGADNIPWAYFQILNFNAKIRYGFRNIINSFQKYGFWDMRRVARKASKIWVVTKADYEMVSNVWRCPCELMPITGTDPVGCARIHKYTSDQPLKIVWSGLMEGRKALPILFKSLILVEDKEKIRLTILGAGPEQESWACLAEKLGIQSLIDWKGKLPLDAAKKCMAEADLFVLTSIKEGTPTVLMEAIQCGLPVVCHDACGMAFVVDETCGIKIPMINPQDSVEGFYSAIMRLLDEPDQLVRLSQGALERARELSWDQKAKNIANVYINSMEEPLVNKHL